MRITGNRKRRALGPTCNELFLDKRSLGAYLQLNCQHGHYEELFHFLSVVVFKILHKDLHLLARAMYL